jgi:hypothetical protein
MRAAPIGGVVQQRRGAGGVSQSKPRDGERRRRPAHPDARAEPLRDLVRRLELLARQVWRQEVEHDLAQQSSRGGGPLQVAELLGDLERLARHRQCAVVFAAPAEGVADGVAQERLAGAPADVARETERLWCAKLVGNGGAHERRGRRHVEGPTGESEHAERVGEAAPVVRRAEQCDGAVEVRRRRVLIAADVVCHRDQVHRLAHAAAVAEPLEYDERFLVVREAGLRLVEVDVPVADAVETSREERAVSDDARQRQCVAPILARARVVARGPEQPERAERLPRRTMIVDSARLLERRGEVLVRALELGERLVRPAAREAQLHAHRGAGTFRRLERAVEVGHASRGAESDMAWCPARAE